MASRNKLNPRFDHWCRVYRITGATELSDGEEETIYDGKCFVYEANNLRNYTKVFGAVEANREDMGCCIPGHHPEIHAGDLLDFVRYEEKGTALQIPTPIPTKMGTEIRFNKPKV